jgi:hypothetical protein
VTTGDMGRKTIGNDLDNAWIKFDQVKLPKDALLNRWDLTAFLLFLVTGWRQLVF